MKSIHDFELPAHLKPVLARAKKLEWITVGYMLSVIVIMYLTAGSSQAMKTAWLEDVLSLVPALAFLIGTKINDKKANKRFPYGYHRVFSISFLAGAVALMGIGLFLVFDSTIALIKQEHPTIGLINVFGNQIWMGWIMIVALIYSAVPPYFIGSKKIPLAEKLHNKVLYTDASTQKADYMTALAAIVGILLVGAGFWWGDAAAALFISFSVLKDGYKHIKEAALDLMDRYPQLIKKQEDDPLLLKLEKNVKQWPWVADAAIRFRESGQVYFGQIAVVPKGDFTLSDILQGYEQVRKLHWKFYDFTIDPVQELPPW